jgi:LysM repeat protein
MLSTRLFSLAAAIVAAGTLVFCNGCSGHSSNAANAQTPPPQSLSEPVHVTQAAPVTEEPRAVAVSVRENEPLPAPIKSQQRVGESRELPTFVAPAPTPIPPAPKPAPAAAQNPASGEGRYHTLAKGETLSAVSRKYNVRLKSILDANHFKDPNHLSVGTKVFVPGN